MYLKDRLTLLTLLFLSLVSLSPVSPGQKVPKNAECNLLGTHLTLDSSDSTDIQDYCLFPHQSPASPLWEKHTGEIKMERQGEN